MRLPSGRTRWAGAIAGLLLVVAALAIWLPGGAAWSRSESGPGLPEVSVRALPPEARETIRLIRAGGPFPYDRDGIVFGNREKLLPLRPRGHYREYTVRTPGASNRGARRIVAAETGELYYTEDHYASFRRIRE